MKALNSRLVVLFLGITSTVFSQPCRQITVDDTAQANVLRKYITECVHERFFADDKGVVVVTRFVNEHGRPAWLVNALLDDRYKDNPPVEWAQLDRDIVLFYSATSRYNVTKTPATAGLLRCLDEAIGDRLYIRPPKRDRWFRVSQPNGKTITVQGRRITGGSSQNDKVIIFEADGKITILNSV